MALANKSAGWQTRIDVQQQIDYNSGHVIGVNIEHLNLSGVSPEDAFLRVVREPLEQLFRQSPAERVFILVDALDEALLYKGDLNIVSLVSEADFLPDCVRFLVTSRREDNVLDYLRRPGTSVEEHSLSNPGNQSKSLKDMERHLQHVLADYPALKNNLDSNLSVETFAAVVRAKSKGNFLYVHHLVRMLLNRAERISLESLNQFPDGLDGIYLEFLTRLLQVVGGKIAWSRKCTPILGTLAVARETFNEEQIAGIVGKNVSQIRQYLAYLRQFLDFDATLSFKRRSYTIYHR